jgi:peroxiredoxin
MSLLESGSVINDFALPSTAGDEPFLSDVRGRSAMVLVLGAEGPNAIRMLLRETAAQNARIGTSDGKLCIVIAMPLADARRLASEERWPFVVLADANGAVHRRLGAADESSTPRAAVYITDRFGEVYAAFNEASLPTVEQVVSWLDFVGIQCEECFPPEWQD